MRFRLAVWVSLLGLITSSCGTRVPHYDYQTLAHAAIQLGMDIEKEDNHFLYTESAEWLGVPYCVGGNDHKGIDCSGLVSAIYKKVYHKKLERNSEGQRKKNCSKVRKNNLQEGDIVFFHNGRNKRTATHVGIYLKQNKFIHASTSQGVIVSCLSEPYYQRCWMQGGRVKGIR